MFDCIRAQDTSAWFFFFSSRLNQLRHSFYRCEMNRSCNNAIVAHTLHTVIRMPLSIGLLLYKSLACRDVGPQHYEGVLSVCLQINFGPNKRFFKKNNFSAFSFGVSVLFVTFISDFSKLFHKFLKFLLTKITQIRQL